MHMVNQQTDSQLQENLIEDNDVLGGGDFIDDFPSLKGMFSEALGRLEFKLALVVVLLFSFAYTVHNAFAKSTKSK